MTQPAVLLLELFLSPENPAVILVLGAGVVVTWRYVRARRGTKRQ
jgi:hypothetical protein